MFADTAQFVSHRLAASRVAARNDPRTPVPDVTFDDYLRLELGGKVVELYYPGRAHSDNDIVLVYPARRIAFTTDVIPVRALPAMRFGYPAEYVTYLRWIEDNLDFDVLVAGHSPLGTMATVRELRGFIEDLGAAVRTARAGGLEDNSTAMVDAVRAELEPRYGTWEGFQRLAGGVEAVIRSEGGG